MADLNDLADFLEALSDQLPQMTSDLAKTVTMAVVDEMATITPADTGAAISNWQVTLDAPALEEIPAYSPSPSRYDHAGNRRGSGVGSEVTRANNYPLVMDNAALTLAEKRPGQDIYITNIVGTDKEPAQPYILDLDKGWSSQFPTGDFVGQASLVVEQVLASARLIVK